MLVAIAEAVSLPRCCLDLDIDLLDLIFPERMNEAGREFVQAHGLMNLTLSELQAGGQGVIDLGGGRVKIFHRCDQLADDGSCRIYATRPKICREFNCEQRRDCACQGRGWIGDKKVE